MVGGKEVGKGGWRMRMDTGELNLKDLSSEDPRVRYGCAKGLLAIAKENPAELYPHFDFFVRLLDDTNRIFKWTAIIVIGHLSRIDERKKTGKVLEKIIGFLDSGNMITANNAIGALGNIAKARPEYQDKITRELLKVEHYGYDTPECRNIAMGKVIEAIGPYFGQLKNKKAVCEFVARQTKNARPATSKKAERFLAKMERMK